MRPFRYDSPLSLIVPALLAILLSGCSALNPLRDVEPGPDSGWSRPARTAQATPRPATPPPSAPARTRTPAPERQARPVSVEMGPSVRAENPVLMGAAALSFKLRDATEDWLGIPYRYGGTTRDGIDCSAFVQAYMGEVLDLHLTRSTASQVEEGTEVAKADLRPGDLVFFRRRGTRHVGVYLGEGEFIHASSSNGVIVSRLDEGYYERHYWTARRVLGDPSRFLAEQPASAHTETPPRSSEGSSSGSSW